MAIRVFGSPGRYLQGPGAIASTGAVARALGDRACVVIDEGVRSIAGPALAESLDAAGVHATMLPFAGEITHAAIDRLSEAARLEPASSVVAVGGGKALDAGKGVARQLGVPVVTVPTAASNDAPTSAIFVVYDAHHAVATIERMASNPHTVIVDTALIARAPSRFLRWGIGDALSKVFEAGACRDGRGVTPFGTRPLRTGMAIAEAAYAILRRHTAAALAAVERREVTDDVEAVVEACILLSGLGFENGGLSVAHSMTRGLGKARGARNAPHGEQVAYATLVQVASEGRSETELLDLHAFCREIGLPVRLRDLGLPDATNAEIDEIARLTLTAPHMLNVPHEIDAGDIASAMRRVEAIGP